MRIELLHNEYGEITVEAPDKGTNPPSYSGSADGVKWLLSKLETSSGLYGHTLYPDYCRAADLSAAILLLVRQGEIHLVSKTGGREPKYKHPAGSVT